MTDEREDLEQPDDDQVDDATLRDALRGDPVAKAQFDGVLANMRRNQAEIAKIVNVKSPVAGVVAHLAAEKQRQDEWQQRQQADWAEAAEARQREHQRELDWQNGLLGQTQLTVDALTAMGKAQDDDRAEARKARKDDRRINLSILGIAAAAFVVAVIGVIIQLAK